MFKKLLSNLPFNPSLISQVSFYAKRLQQESSVRRIGLVFVALGFAVQIFAAIAPVEASNQCSSNDVIRCGFRTREEAVQRCNSNAAGFRSILEYYGISCGQLAGAGTQTVRSNAYNNELFSMGRNPYSKPGEYPISIPSAGTFYLRPLSSWGNTSYKMLVTQTSDGQPFMVMYDCGNIVIKRGYTPPAKPEPPAKLKLAKVNEPKGTVKPGDTIKYTLAFTNTGGTAAFFSVNDTLGPELEFVKASYGEWIFTRTGQKLKWANNTPPFYTFGNTDSLGTPGFITVEAKVKSGTPKGTSVCNTAWVEDVNIQTKQVQKWSEVTVCNKVDVECPPGTTPQPDGSCKTPEKPIDKLPLLTIEKKAKNLTQKIDDANGTTAAAGDIIEYSLTTKNFGDGEAKDVILRPEEIADVLEYSDLDFNSLNGAIFDPETQTIAWNKPVDIKPGQSVTKKFKVKIKSPIPQTPSPAGNPGSFDLKLTNVYGNTVEIKLPNSITKATEQTTQTLPNTGPGEAMVIGALLITFVGYFFARSRLMVKELEIIKEEYASGV